MSNKIQKNIRGELVFGLVGALGTKLGQVTNFLNDNLKEVGYTPHTIQLSSLMEGIINQVNKIIEKENKMESKNITKLQLPLKKPEDKRIDTHMKAGNDLREIFDSGDAIALLAIKRIMEIRDQNKNKSNAYILRSLKHDDEVYSLRRIYGSGFVLIGVYSSYDNRRKHLSKKIAESYNSGKLEDYNNIAEKLIKRDEQEPNEFGQRVNKTFYLSDFFISIDNEDNAKKELKRFIELLFGNTSHTPKKDECLMNFAQAAALRSGDLSRQVGAVLASDGGEILSVGTNDVPCYNGGLYWAEDPKDKRDNKLGYDSNTREINSLLEKILNSFEKRKKFSKEVKNTYIKNIYKILKKEITEFGRSVHAEMDAITQAVRLGIPIKGATLYVTLFPCHNCTKHIVASGIKKVIYIEPYTKSKAEKLHKDSIVIDKEECKKVCFLPFVGVGPRLYNDLFSLKTHSGYQLERKDVSTGKAIKWDSEECYPRLFLNPKSYKDREKGELNKRLYDEDKKCLKLNLKKED